MKSDEVVDRGALRMVGTMLRLVRLVDGRLRRGSRLDLGLTDVSVLARIGQGIDRPSDLAAVLGLDRPRITRVTERLVKMELLERWPDVDDRRRCRLTLTPRGEERLRAGLVFASSIVDAILHDLPAEQRTALAAALESLRPVLDGMARTHEPASAALLPDGQNSLG